MPASFARLADDMGEGGVGQRILGIFLEDEKAVREAAEIDPHFATEVHPAGILKNFGGWIGEMMAPMGIVAMGE